MGHSRSGSFGGGPQQSIPTSMPNLVWNPLIETSFQLGRVSREEELQLERKRCAAFGITNYELDPKSGSFIFPAAGSLFSCTDSDSSKQTSTTHFHEVINTRLYFLTQIFEKTKTQDEKPLKTQGQNLTNRKKFKENTSKINN